jgi:hypothetical protein
MYVPVWKIQSVSCSGTRYGTGILLNRTGTSNVDTSTSSVPVHRLRMNMYRYGRYSQSVVPPPLVVVPGTRYKYGTGSLLNRTGTSNVA